ncbi:uncharacterized protein LOC112465071 [Temnothorax curvispinosus]|uniref:Uncharacterized protein LOC112465071 n=1 Tax=Temnothorax curvispinosus TaxID=300111 RepID=A0A6J1R5Q0_9HYME|nr:uncharacterized protein LOC112465071 [Temnothorax curvispinosus]
MTSPSSFALSRNRPRRSLFSLQNTHKVIEWNCAIIKHDYGNNTEVTERTCVLSDYKCTESLNHKCEIKKCNSNECNNANALSINMVTSTWFILSWTTVFILTSSY